MQTAFPLFPQPHPPSPPLGGSRREKKGEGWSLVGRTNSHTDRPELREATNRAYACAWGGETNRGTRAGVWSGGAGDGKDGQTPGWGREDRRTAGGAWLCVRENRQRTVRVLADRWTPGGGGAGGP